MSGRYRRKSSYSSIVSDSAYIASRLSWRGALILGFVSFVFFYWLLPGYLESRLNPESLGNFYPMVEQVIGKRIHWSQWIGYACALSSLFFAVRNYYFVNRAGYEERGIVVLLSKLISRRID